MYVDLKGQCPFFPKGGQFLFGFFCSTDDTAQTGSINFRLAPGKACTNSRSDMLTVAVFFFLLRFGCLGAQHRLIGLSLLPGLTTPCLFLFRRAAFPCLFFAGCIYFPNGTSHPSMSFDWAEARVAESAKGRQRIEASMFLIFIGRNGHGDPRL